jgi:nitrogen regulatory protein PII
MKKLEAILPLSSAQHVVEQLRTLEIDNLITTNVTVFDKNSTRKMIYRGFAYNDNSSSRVKVEVNVSDSDAQHAQFLLAENIVK